MSERKWLYVWMLLAYIAGSVTSGALYLRGKQVGRAEQKRWDDTYYAAHPVVKEHLMPTEVPECAIIDGFAYARLPLKFPAPPKKAKPAKASNRVNWEGGPTGTTISLPVEREIYCDSSVPPGDGWLPLTSAPHDGTIVEIAETYGYTPWYDFYQFVDGGWKQASNHAYGLNGEKCGYWRPRKVQPIPDQELILNCAPNFDCNKHNDIDPLGAVCVAGSSDGHPIEIPCPQITWPAPKP